MFFFEDFLSRFHPRAPRCSCGRQHTVAVRDILVGSSAFEESADLLRKRYGEAPRLWVLSDENTEAAAGEQWRCVLREGPRLVSRVLPARPKPVPTLELARALGVEARSAAPDLLVSVGSGVISDLVKKISLDSGLPNWCVATAPSVDAYTSATAAIRVNGYTASLPAGPSDAVICDLGVMSRAPHELFLAGLGDLLAKFIAYIDWNLAHILSGEYYCEAVEGFALESARKALAAAREKGGDPFAAAQSLTDAVLVSGLAMQALRASRPAASAEHTIAHFWEMAGAAGNEALDLHGILVGAASRLVLRGYRSFYRGVENIDPDVSSRVRALAREPSWEAQVDEEMRPFIGKIREVMKGRRFDPAKTAERLEAFRRERDRILALAAQALDELAGAVDLLEGFGYPFSLRELGISPRYGTLAMRNIRLLRNRYSTFNLAHELGCEGELVAEAGRQGEG